MKNTRAFRKNLVPPHCEIPDCDFKHMVTRHRIKPGRKGGKYVPGNVIGLCPNCHAMAEMGLYSQEYLFGIVHARLRRENATKKPQSGMYLNGFITEC